MSFSKGTFLHEISKRPFVRPLIFWIAGIILQICFPLQTVSIGIIAFISVFMIAALLVPRKPPFEFLYHSRWVWGMIFALLMVFLAIQMTYMTELRLQYPSEPGLLLTKAKEMQLRMVAKLDLLRLPDVDKSVLATLTVNYRKAMSWEVRNQFSVTGVVHLLAVSGFHVGIVCAFVNLLLSVFPKRRTLARWMKFILTMCSVWAFAYITGLATAAVRAAVMITIYFTGRGIFGRNADRYNTLAGAAFCMLVYNPFYLFDVGFQLSYIAVFFILYLQPRFKRMLEIRNPLIGYPWDVLTVTCSAQIGTVFLCSYYFGQTSLVFLFTNLSLSLLATILIPATLIWMLIPVSIPGMAILRWIIETLTRWFMSIVESFAFLPGAALQVRFDFFTLISSYLCLTLFLLYFRSHRYPTLIAALLVLLIMIYRQAFLSFI